ncbi:phage baseplate assembly protein V [Ignatzschineria rhizosphaerae]|uniref:Phage baseplate assembly protein V n=1 Tax=Ignatzschineria rhizosphaerae TaxID=2923279 RepID=A0ABY3X1L8_9GAMM|nr:phage baseplate assembly protein V [Ignatzschineria rhizosphaerae]UNM95661.1 phage baseplate assembly protein V [Ignatzschineria rhizosphaerae]
MRRENLRTLIRQGRLAILNDATDTQVAQVELFADEVVEGVERIQNYGFTSMPTEGGVYLMNIGGKGNQPVIIAVNDDKTRLRVMPGEVAIYHSEGHHVILKANGVIEADCTTLIANAEESVTVTTQTAEINATTSATIQSEVVTVDAPLTSMTGNLMVAGGIGTGGQQPEAGKVKIKGDFELDGSMDATGKVKSENVSLSDHDHDTSDGKTEKPNKGES